jgi:hypothetical protein
MEGNVFARQVNKGTGMLSKIFDEYLYEPTGAKEAVDAGDICRYRPVLNLLENVPPTYSSHCRIRLTLARCSQMKQQMPEFLGMVL